jgi:hypothetical protein
LATALGLYFWTDLCHTVGFWFWIMLAYAVTLAWDVALLLRAIRRAA